MRASAEDLLLANLGVSTRSIIVTAATETMLLEAIAFVAFKAV